MTIFILKNVIIHKFTDQYVGIGLMILIERNLIET